ncbi:MAG: hypothetical protein HRU25_14635 [Psychrobium sp.]|nr:hypothetical protein [Psychrobium sp.]
MRLSLSRWLVFCMLFCCNFEVNAGVSLYLPLQINPAFELEIERLVTITKYPTLKKPYHVATILQYLEQVKNSHPSLYSRINRYIKRFNRPAGLSHYQAQLRISDSTKKTLPNARGLSTNSEGYVEMSAFWQMNEYVIANVGGYSNKQNFLNFGSFLSIGGKFMQFDLGYREHWLSPMQDNSMIISTQAVPMLGVTVSNVAPMTDWNMMYELSFGRLNEVDNIKFDGVRGSGKPGYLSMHASLQPLDWWTLSFNRTMQFGGGERRQVTLTDIWKAIIDPVRSDNCGGLSDLEDCKKEFGNQQMSIGNRFDLNLNETSFNIIFEMAAEDTNDYSNYKFGNKAFSLSLFIPYLSDTDSLTLTAQEIHDAWYVHGIYGEGYSNDGHKMGHWWGDEKGQHDRIGAQIISVQYSKEICPTSLLAIKYHTIKNGDKVTSGTGGYQRGHYLQLDYQWQYKSGLLGLHLYTGRDVSGDSFASLAFSKQW